MNARPLTVDMPVELEQRISSWHHQRQRIAHREEAGPIAAADVWYDSDNEAADLLHELCDIAGIERTTLTHLELNAPDAQ